MNYLQEPEGQFEVAATKPWYAPLNQVTKLSKITAAVVLISLPFAAFFTGMQYDNQSSVRSASEPVDLNSLDRQAADAAVVVEVQPLKHNHLSLPTVEYKLADQETPYPRTGLVVEKKDFSYQGKPGAVLQVCEYSYAALMNNFGSIPTAVCLGENYLFLEFEGEFTEIETFTTPTVDSVKLLSSIGFNEGHFVISTNTSRVEAVLLVSMNRMSCLTMDGMCLSHSYISNKVSFPERQAVTVVVSEDNFVSSEMVLGLEYLSWNQSGTKAIYNPRCFAGCQENIFLGYSLATDSLTPLITYDEASSLGIFGKKEVVWEGENEVEVNDIKKSF